MTKEVNATCSQTWNESSLYWSKKYAAECDYCQAFEQRISISIVGEGGGGGGGLGLFMFKLLVY